MLLDRLAFQAEILLEGHLAGHEDQIGRAHPDRSGGDRRDAQFGAAGEDLGPDVDHEEVEPVDEQIDAVQEVVDVVVVDPVGETPDLGGRVDVARHAGHHIDLGLAERGGGSADLAVEIDCLEDIHVGDMERPDAKARQRQQMNPADTAHSRDGDPFGAQYLLLPLGDPSDVAAERLVIIEVGRRAQASLEWSWSARSLFSPGRPSVSCRQRMAARRSGIACAAITSSTASTPSGIQSAACVRLLAAAAKAGHHR